MTRMKRVAKILDWKVANSFEWTVDTRKPSSFNHENKLSDLVQFSTLKHLKIDDQSLLGNSFTHSLPCKLIFEVIFGTDFSHLVVETSKKSCFFWSNCKLSTIPQMGSNYWWKCTRKFNHLPTKPLLKVCAWQFSVTSLFEPRKETLSHHMKS